MRPSVAAGAPAVASDIPALRELGGDTVRFALPDSASDFAAVISDVLDHGEETRVAAQRARERISCFTWDACAAQRAQRRPSPEVFNRPACWRPPPILISSLPSAPTT